MVETCLPCQEGFPTGDNIITTAKVYHGCHDNASHLSKHVNELIIQVGVPPRSRSRGTVGRIHTSI